ncbi:MAG: HDOD domain-containing protein, partial [Deltaproteobacteria bacterium]
CRETAVDTGLGTSAATAAGATAALPSSRCSATVLVVAAAVKQVHKPFGLTENMLWEHSFAAGLAANMIAAEIQQINGEEAFLGGLFHDLGKTVMNIMDSKKFQVVMQKCYNNGTSFSEAEQYVYPYTHAEVGGLVIRKWNFPESLINAVFQHHSLDFSEDDDPYQVKLSCVVGLANLFCHKAGIGVREPDENLFLHQTKAAKMLDLSESQTSSLLNKFEVIYNQDKSFFV